MSRSKSLAVRGADDSSYFVSDRHSVEATSTKNGDEWDARRMLTRVMLRLFFSRDGGVTG
jgi:hypothetical protein